VPTVLSQECAAGGRRRASSDPASDPMIIGRSPWQRFASNLVDPTDDHTVPADNVSEARPKGRAYGAL